MKKTPIAAAAATQPQASAARPKQSTVQLPPLTEHQLNVLIAGLGKLSLEVALEMFSIIQKAASEQLGQPPAAQ